MHCARIPKRHTHLWCRNVIFIPEHDLWHDNERPKTINHLDASRITSASAFISIHDTLDRRRFSLSTRLESFLRLLPTTTNLMVSWRYLLGFHHITHIGLDTNSWTNNGPNLTTRTILGPSDITTNRRSRLIFYSSSGIVGKEIMDLFSTLSLHHGTWRY